jgi:hypothetical protein
MPSTDYAQFEYPERLMAMRMTAEMVTTLGAAPAAGSCLERLAYETARGDRIVCVTAEARVVLSAETYRLDVTMLPGRTLVAMQGEHSSEATLGLYLLDYLAEHGDLPGDPDRLSALEIANLADLRRQGAAD